MVTEQTQIKINLPIQLRDFLASKAQKFGVPIASYVKHLIIQDVGEMDYPEFKMSEKAEKAYKKALKDQKAGKIIQVDDLDKFFREL